MQLNKNMIKITCVKNNYGKPTDVLWLWVGLGLDRFLECLHFDQIFGEVPSRINFVHFWSLNEFLFSIMSFSDCHLYFRNQQGLTAHTHQKHPKDPDSKSDVRCQFCSKIFTCKDLLYQVLLISLTASFLWFVFHFV